MSQLKKQSSFLFLFTALLTIIFINLSCEDNPVTPDEPPPGSRDYTWTVDTLAIPFMSFNRIWGSSPQDVWIVGPGGDLDKTIYHYDGSSWQTDGRSRPVSPLAVWGFAENDVWIGGRDGQIWHYDGSSWIEDTMFVRPREKNIGFQEIWGDSPDNILATGYSGDLENRTAVLAKYIGIKWKLTEFDSLRKHNFLRIRRSNEQSDNYYIQSFEHQTLTSDSLSIFEYKDDNSIKLIYEGGAGSSTRAFIQKIGDEIYFVIGNTINRYVNNEFQPYLEIPFSNFGFQIFGRNKNDIFLRMTDGIAHFNGNNTEYIYMFEGKISITDAVLFENEVFFLAFDISNGNDLIYHGKLE